MTVDNPTLERQIAKALTDTGFGLGDTASLRAVAGAIARSISADIRDDQSKLLGEIGSLADYIRQARTELAHIRAEELGSDQIRMATDELDAVVTATEDATGSIMDACENIETLASEQSKTPADAIIDEVTRIYEACSFQDITGQRISKVVSTLKHIETRVEEMLATFEGSVESRNGTRATEPVMNGAEHDDGLLNGPQMPGHGVDQDEIDRLLSGSGF